VESPTTLVVPEFVGNNFFNTLGNFLVNPHASLLFVDFASGKVLSLGGTVEVHTSCVDDRRHPADDYVRFFAGAERYWRFFLDQGTLFPSPLSFTDVDSGASPNGTAFRSPNALVTGSWADAKSKWEASDFADQWRPFRVVRVVEESTVIKSFYLEPADDKGVSPFSPGQYLTLKVPTPQKPTVRTYTVSSAPNDGSYYRISVKKEANASKWLHENVDAGSQLDVKAPRGDFFLDVQTKERPAVLIGGGVGATPLVSMLRHVHREGSRTRWNVRRLFFAHVSHDASQRAFFEGTKQFAVPDKISVTSILSSVDGRLSKETLQALLPLDDYDFYVCGPSGFLQATYDVITTLGVPDDRIHAESFGPAALQRQSTDEPPVATEAVAVKFCKSGVEAPWDESSGTLLEFAEKHGLEPDYGCRLGSCGTCAAKLLRGAVSYAGMRQPTGDIEDVCLICQARPAAGTDLIELDL